MRIVGKGKKLFVCTTCNTRGTQLNRLYGTWPPESFNLLSVAEKTQYWNDIKKSTGSNDLKLFTDNYINVEKVEGNGSQNVGEYAPLRVWKKKGYSTKRIKANCKDKFYDPIIGWVYKVKVYSEFQRKSEDRVEAEKTTVGAPRSAPNLRLGSF